MSKKLSHAMEEITNDRKWQIRVHSSVHGLLQVHLVKPPLLSRRTDNKLRLTIDLPYSPAELEISITDRDGEEPRQ